MDARIYDSLNAHSIAEEHYDEPECFLQKPCVAEEENVKVMVMDYWNGSSLDPSRKLGDCKTDESTYKPVIIIDKEEKPKGDCKDHPNVDETRISQENESKNALCGENLSSSENSIKFEGENLDCHHVMAEIKREDPDCTNPLVDEWSRLPVKVEEDSSDYDPALDAQEGHIEGSETMNQSGEKLMSCPFCEFQSAWSSSLHRHLRSHKGGRPFLCEYCTYKTSHSGNLRAHMRVHTGEKPFTCDVCGFKSSRSSVLKDHKRTHTGDKPYSCDQCEFRTSSKGLLNGHARTHSGVKPYACDLCDYRAARSGTLKDHMKSHTGEKPYSCPHCNYRGSRLTSLNSHLKVHSTDKQFGTRLLSYLREDWKWRVLPTASRSKNFCASSEQKR